MPAPKTKLDLRYSFRNYLLQQYDRGARKWRFTGETREDFLTWQRRTRRKLQRLIGGRGERCDLNLRRITVAETETYRHDTIYYDTRPGLTATAALLTPLGAQLPAPAVLCPPGHGDGVKQLLVPDDNTYKGYPLRLAERGFVVLVPEHIGFGERAGRSLDDTRANHFFFYHSTLLLGENMLGYLLWDLVRAIDVLQSLPEARKHSIGCYGLSLGGEMTLFLAACDVRIRVACISGFLSSYRSSFLDVGHCGCGYVFQMARFMEHEDIAALIAPRPLLVESGYADSAFRVAEARRVVRNLRFLYRKLGCAENIVHHVHSGGHEIIATEAVNWLDRWLRD